MSAHLANPQPPASAALPSDAVAPVHHGHSYPRHLEKIALNLHPGQIGVDSERPLATLLGSCVAVCLYDPQLRLFGMNHFLLPHVHKRTSTLDANLAGMAAMDNLINRMLKQGASWQRLRAKAFGGANLLNLRRGLQAGEANIRFASDWLASERIPLLACDWGGEFARKIVADPATGDVYCRRITPLPIQEHQLMRAEVLYQHRLQKELEARTIDFF